MLKSEIEELIKTDIFTALNLNDLPLEEKMKLLEQIFEVVFKGIWLRVLENLSLENQEELENKILNNEFQTPQAFYDYLTTLIPNFDDLVKEEIANYKKVLLAKF